MTGDSRQASPTKTLSADDNTMETDAADINGNPGAIAGLETSITAVFNCSHSPQTASPTKTNANACKRSRQTATVDASKFNRSNRKSKNCAIFYFKHLDTDTENKDEEWSSQVGSEAAFNKSALATSEDGEEEEEEEEDEWYYSSEQKGTTKHSDSQVDMVDGLDNQIKMVCIWSVI